MKRSSVLTIVCFVCFFLTSCTSIQPLLKKDKLTTQEKVIVVSHYYHQAERLRHSLKWMKLTRKDKYKSFLYERYRQTARKSVSAYRKVIKLGETHQKLASLQRLHLLYQSWHDKLKSVQRISRNSRRWKLSFQGFLYRFNRWKKRRMRWIYQYTLYLARKHRVYSKTICEAQKSYWKQVQFQWSKEIHCTTSRKRELAKKKLHLQTFQIRLYTTDDKRKAYRHGAWIRKSTKARWVPDGKWQDRYARGKLKGLLRGFRHYKNGKYHGPMKYWSASRKLIYSASYHHGRLIGKQEVNYDNGTPRFRLTYNKQGKPDGKESHFFYNGKLSLSGHYKNGVKVGVWKEWHENGKLKYQRNYRKGKIHGMAHRWYFTGKQLSIEQFHNGKQCGTSIFWDESNQERREKNFGLCSSRGTKPFGKTGKKPSQKSRKRPSIPSPAPYPPSAIF